MVNSGKRDNAYWRQRLKKDGREDLLEQIDAGLLTVYRASQIAGYRAKGSPVPAAKLSYHWKRASYVQRRAFLTANFDEVRRVMRDIYDDAKAAQAKKSETSDEKQPDTSVRVS